MYAFEQDVPIDTEVYAKICEGIGDQIAPGFVLHIAIEREDGHLSYLDLWESKEDCERFTEERLHPVVGPVLAGAGVRVQAEPPRREVTVVDVWGPAFPRAATV
jgi:hypothetical protein